MIDRRNGGETWDRDAGEPMKVPVAGGIGITERLVRGTLGVVDGTELAYTSRKKPDNSPRRRFPLRIAVGHNEICGVLRKHDWAVNCTDPFKMHADSLARACIDSGIGYIDANDSIDARCAITALDGDTQREGVPVLTGLGLYLDLSTTLLILRARAAGAEEVRNVRADLRIGVGQESEAASVEPMFRTICGGYHVVLGNAIVEARRNPVLSQSGIGYECPDVDVVCKVCLLTRGYFYHVASDALPDESVEKIRTSRLHAMPAVSGLLVRLGTVVTSRKARAKDTPQPAELVVALSPASAGDAGSPAETTVVQVIGPGSYKMTAAIAVVTAVVVVGKLAVPGCRDFVGHPRLLEPVLAFAHDAGIHIKAPHDNPTTGLLPIAAHCDTKGKGKR